MFVGFIAVVVILLVLVAIFVKANLDNSSSSQYVTEAKKIHALISNINAESQFYTVNHDNFNGLHTDYLQSTDFAKGVLVPTSNMAHADWSGWPSDPVLPDPYTGAYIPLGGTAGDNMRIILEGFNNGQNAGIFILKRNNANIPAGYTATLETVLSSEPSYIGG